MGTVNVDQIGPNSRLIRDVDTTLSNAEKDALLLAALPGATIENYAGDRVVRFGQQVILKKQVTHLGYPHPEFKKRIQIPRKWLQVHRQAIEDSLTPRFVGIYHYVGVTIFVDFDSATYVVNAANNSAAHVYTNDLFQAQNLGQFSRVDKNGNRLTSVRADQFAAYLCDGYDEQNPHVDVFERFSKKFLDGARVEGLDAAKAMHAANWPDKFQNEWAGFYVEFRLSRFLKEHDLEHLVVVQKEKRKGEFDYDLQLRKDGVLDHYGDLKASNVAVKESPGNDAADFYRCLDEHGRFWYVIYEHETWHGRDSDNESTIAWNEWRRSAGHIGRSKTFNPLSYASRFKEAVRFVRVSILEVNQANAHVALGDFQKNFRQPDGKPRKGKVMIKKKDIGNFVIYSRTIETNSFTA